MFILVSRVTGCVSISAFASSVCVFAAVTSSAIGIKKFPITTGIKQYKSIIKNMLGKSKLNTIEILIYRNLIDSYISHDELVSVNNVLIDYYEV